jgi:hypothetical protein
LSFGQVENDDPVPHGTGSRGGDDVFFTGMHDDRDQDLLEEQLAVDLYRVHSVEDGVVSRSERVPGEIEAPQAGNRRPDRPAQGHGRRRG